MTDFKMIRDEYSWDEVHAQIYDATDQDVQHALEKDHLTIADFRALISPAANGTKNPTNHATSFR